MSTIKDDKKKQPKGPLVITKQSPKKAKLGSPDIQFTTINHTYYFRGPQGCPDVLGTEKYKMQLNKKEDEHNPLKNGRCGAMVNLPVGCFSNLPPDYSAFGNNALNTAQPGFPNKGYRCDNQDPPLIWIDSLRSTYNHPAKDCFPTSESRHITIISSMLPYSSSYRNYLIDDIRSNLPNIHINMNIPHIHFCIDIQRSTENTGSYIVVNPSGENWPDIAFLAPTLCANNLLEIGVDSEENCFLTLPDEDAYNKFCRILQFLQIDHTLDNHLKPVSDENLSE
jgi:hypothetical protein